VRLGLPGLARVCEGSVATGEWFGDEAGALLLGDWPARCICAACMEGIVCGVCTLEDTDSFLRC
jgi:hypothetical protein